MNKFERLTKYIPLIQDDKFGQWIIDKENDGIPEHRIHMPFVNYSQTVDFFHEDLYKFCEEHPEYEHTRYGETLEANGLKWGTESMEAADASSLDAKCVIALLMGAVRAERFCDGALLGFFKSECILCWLQRLKAIDEGGVSNVEQETE
ncbi:DUF6508 domain-containing protein [Clostridium sp. CX1]|uniref:DUF6508 domain-containing protein n=1 Tax=Clostridium sp. CX1 TaxID=2978346 RepID=UPI0021C0EE31|nr:DUF6508 domain-containing protein [Clostridium sp. CX1]MCT8977881.1 DUF6508 domain-containing protein [Clostridium sp. CX1]